MALIFSGESLVAHHNVGNTPYLLVTFIGAFYEKEAETLYFLKDFAEGDNVSCVGVTSRERNFYLSDEINEIARKTQALRRPSQKIVLIGQSVGGFAAVKFAALFAADYVLAFSPIFSVHEDDLDLPKDDRESRHFLQQALKFHRIPPEVIKSGMHPAKADCNCPLLLVYPADISIDKQAADLFRNIFPSAVYIQANYLGHAVFEHVVNRGVMLPILDHLVDDNVDGARHLIRRALRNNEIAISELIVRVARWRPAMVPVALRTSRARESLKSDDRYHFSLVYSYEMVARGQTARAITYLQQFYAHMFPDNGPESGLFVVISYFGDVLTYDSDLAQVIFAPDTLRGNKRRTPALLDLRSTTPGLIVRTRSADLSVFFGGATAEPPREFEVLPVCGNSLMTIRQGERYLHGAQHSVASFSASEALAWEHLALLPTSGKSGHDEISSLGWLDQSILAVRVASPPTKTGLSAEASDRRTKFRAFLRLFGG